MARNAITVCAAVVLSCCACLVVSRVTQPAVSGGVAVVDLDEVSRRLGRYNEMQNSLQTKAEETKQKLTAIEQSAIKQLQEARNSLGATPDAEQAQKFQKLQKTASLQLNQIKQRAELEVSSHRQQLVQEFREQARPIAARIAKEQGFDAVMTRNDSLLFSYENTVDITDEVTKAMAAMAPAAATAQPQEAEEPKETVQQVSHETTR